MDNVLIGESMTEVMDETRSAANNDSCGQQESVIHSLMASERHDCGDSMHMANSNTKERRVLVQGPFASSLAMNTACAIASQCQCRFIPCQCVAVAFLTHMRGTETETALFPLQSQHAKWNQRTLKRIQVIRFPNAMGLISHLLNLHADSNCNNYSSSMHTSSSNSNSNNQPQGQQQQHQKQRPWGALIVDGIDQFVTQQCSSDENTPASTGIDNAMCMMQILAILAETGKVLERMSGNSLLVVATTTTTTLPFLTMMGRTVRNWYPYVIHIQSRTMTSEPMHTHDDTDDHTIQSMWSANLVEPHGAEIAFSVIVQKANGERLIRFWE